MLAHLCPPTPHFHHKTSEDYSVLCVVFVALTDCPTPSFIHWVTDSALMDTESE